METNFDKEIDAILRCAARQALSVPPADHLSADEIAAFAENVLPLPVRQSATAHFADCDRCRTILAGVISLTEVEPATNVPTRAIEAASERRGRAAWLTAARLAYVFGGMIIVLGAFLAIAVFRIGREPANTTLSQATNTEAADTARETKSESPPVAANTAQTASPTPDVTDYSSSEAARAAANSIPLGVIPNRQDRRAANSADAALALGEPSPAELAANVKKEPAVSENKNFAPPRVSANEKERTSDAAPLNRRMIEELPAPALPAPSKNAAGAEKRLMSRIESPPSGALAVDSSAEPRAKRASGETQPVVRRIGGRTFDLKQGVWYDRSYGGQAAVNVRRGSAEYAKLDRELRSIAESLGGVVVAVVGGKAYRIQ